MRNHSSYLGNHMTTKNLSCVLKIKPNPNKKDSKYLFEKLSEICKDVRSCLSYSNLAERKL